MKLLSWLFPKHYETLNQQSPDWLSRNISRDWDELEAIDDGGRWRYYRGRHREYLVGRSGQGHNELSVLYRTRG